MCLLARLLKYACMYLDEMLLWVQKLLPPTKEEVNAVARVKHGQPHGVRLSVCLSVSKITQTRMHGFG